MTQSFVLEVPVSVFSVLDVLMYAPFRSGVGVEVCACEILIIPRRRNICQSFTAWFN